MQLLSDPWLGLSSFEINPEVADRALNILNWLRVDDQRTGGAQERFQVWRPDDLPNGSILGARFSGICHCAVLQRCLGAYWAVLDVDPEGCRF